MIDINQSVKVYGGPHDGLCGTLIRDDVKIVDEEHAITVAYIDSENRIVRVELDGNVELDIAGEEDE